MLWVKSVILDLVMLGVAAAGALFAMEWAWWILAVYTPLMIVLKVVAVAGASFMSQVRGKENQPPPAFFHLLYGLMVVLMLIAAWWPLALGWVAIWGLSIAAERRATRPVVARR